MSIENPFDYFKDGSGSVFIDTRSEKTILKETLLDVSERESRVDAVERWIDGRGSGCCQFTSTLQVTDFLAKLAVSIGGESILDPVCGTGLLLAKVAASTGAKNICGVELNSEVSEIARLVIPECGKVFCNDALKAGGDVDPRYDLIVGEPPMGVKLDSSYEIPTSKKGITIFSDALVTWAVDRLASNGTAIFLLPVTFLTGQSVKMRDYLQSVGISVRACIHVPSGSLKATMVQSYVVVLDRVQREDTFIAQYSSDVGHQKEIIKNFENDGNAKRPAQGRMVKLVNFKGYNHYDAQERLKQLVPRMRLNEVSSDSLFKKIVRATKLDYEFVGSSNVLYLKLVGKVFASVNRSDMPDSLSNFMQLVVNEDVANAHFLAHYFNSDVGQTILWKTRTVGSAIPRISLASLKAEAFYLPDYDIQLKVLDSISRIKSLRAEINEIESDIWNAPAKIGVHAERIEVVNHKDSFDDWLETLPFPLASILWRYHAHSGSAREKSEILLHFFEALAEFFATINLSAIRTDQELWAEHSVVLNQALDKEHLSYDRATFGLWKCVNEFLSKRIRKLLDDDFERASMLYRIKNRDVLNMLLSKDLVRILQAANSIRNSHAHGGVASPREDASIHRNLEGLIADTRKFVGNNWKQYELVQPSDCRFSGGMLEYKVKRIMGTRTPFETVERRTIIGMEDERLHLLSPDGDRALELIPFIRVMPSPKAESNACYYYNRKQGDHQRYVSYHFESESEIEVAFVDTNEAIHALNGNV